MYFKPTKYPFVWLNIHRQITVQYRKITVVIANELPFRLYFVIDKNIEINAVIGQILSDV